MDREQLLSQWKGEESRGMSGWDFSHIDGRYTADSLPWDYREKVREFLRPGVRLLDMGTGGGELLLTLGHPYELTSVTEGWAPNLELCRKRLEPLGITVREYDSERGMPLPFEDNSFDLVINRHESYDLSEVRRVLKSNGFFLTQQVGGENNRPLIRRLCPGEGRFLDVGAVVFQASVSPWEFPDFSVDRCQKALLQLQDQLERLGFIPTLEHRFLIVAKNRK